MKICYSNSIPLLYPLPKAPDLTNSGVSSNEYSLTVTNVVGEETPESKIHREGKELTND